METHKEVKILAAKKAVTMAFLAEFLSKRLGKNYSPQNLANKLARDTIKYSEMKLIAEALEMELVFKDKV